MFNRSIQMKLVKDNDIDSNESFAESSVADTMYIVHETAKKLGKGAFVLMTSYIVLDTLRQIAVNAAPKN